MNNSQKITLVYDGHCRMCSWGVVWILPRIPREHIRYVPSQSEEGSALMKQAGINATNPQSIVVAHGGKLLIKSAAILYLLNQCDGLAYLLGKILGIFPDRFLDWIYYTIATNRYHIFGKLDSCFVPESDDKQG